MMVYDDVSLINLIRFDVIKEKSGTILPFPYSLSPPLPLLLLLLLLLTGVYVLWGTYKHCLDIQTDIDMFVLRTRNCSKLMNVVYGFPYRRPVVVSGLSS